MSEDNNNLRRALFGETDLRRSAAHYAWTDSRMILVLDDGHLVWSCLAHKDWANPAAHWIARGAAHDVVA